MRRAVIATPAGGTIDCEIADGVRPRLIGLIGRDEPDGGAGLLIRPCRSVHTAFMRFACDIVFLARDGRVLRVDERIPPWRVRMAPRRTRVVLELAGGEAARLGLVSGSRLRLPA